jgi:hypothetical protein
MGYCRHASRKSPVGQLESAQNGVTANFCASLKTRPAEKAMKIGPSCVVKWEKRNSRKALTRF